MTIQRMAREASDDAQKASLNFYKIVSSLPLTAKYQEYYIEQWKFKAKKVFSKIFIRSEEYKTENKIATYTFTNSKKIKYTALQVFLSNWRWILELILYIFLYILNPIIGTILIYNSFNIGIVFVLISFAFSLYTLLSSPIFIDIAIMLFFYNFAFVLISVQIIFPNCYIYISKLLYFSTFKVKT